MRSPLLALALLGACRSRAPAPEVEPASPVWQFLAARYDADRDGRITAAEYTRSARGFRQLDADGDGAVTPHDFDERFDGVPRQDEEFVYGEGGPEVGEPAPGFTLPTTDGVELALESFRGHKPVVLVFGSFT
jgi:EF hand domain-containing protein